jgi:guanylate kinase
MDSELQALLANYKPSSTTIDLIKETPILLLVGPTGAGKDSVKEKLIATGQYHHLISHTTRPPRINHGIPEQNGHEYHFIDYDQAKQMLTNQEFVEAKIYSTNLYGTSVAEIQEAHDEDKAALTDIEVQGVAEYKSLDRNVMAVFLLPPDFKTWQERLQRRYGDVVDVEDSRQRLQTALDELQQLLTTDYYVAVINDDLEETFKQIETIVTSKNHTTPDEPKARAVAEQLAHDIQAFLKDS